MHAYLHVSVLVFYDSEVLNNCNTFFPSIYSDIVVWFCNEDDTS